MITFTKEQLIAAAHARIEFAEMMLAGELEPLKERTWSIELELARIALASLEAEPVSEFYHEARWGWYEISEGDKVPERSRIPLYRVPPAPVSVPDEGREQFEEWFKFHYGEDGSIMKLHRANRGANYHDECVDLAWIAWKDSRTAMLQCAEPVTTANKLQDGWVACSERMPDIGTEIFYFCQDDGRRDCGIVSSSNFSGKGDAELYVHAEGYDLRFGVDISHWMPLPASPQQK